jgi:ABC-type multidrug transport system fused ATPase/permease subunit
MVFFGLEEEEYDRQYKDRQLYLRIRDLLHPYQKSMVLAIFFIILSSIAQGLVPFIISRLILRIDQPDNSQFIWSLIALTFTLNILGYGFNYINRALAGRVVNSVVYDLRRSATDSVLKQDMAFFDKFPTGKIVSRINTDTDNFGEMAVLVMQTGSSFVILVILLIPLFAISLVLTAIFLSMIPVIFIITSLFRKVARRKTLEGQQAMASVNAYVQESIAGIQVAKTFRREGNLYEQFLKVNQQAYRVNLGRAMFLNLIFPCLIAIEGVMLAVIVYSGGITVEGISPADLYLYIQSLWVLFFPLFSLASFWPQFQTGLAAAERVFSVIDSESYVHQTGNKVIHDIKGRIDIEHLSFRYSPEKPVFNDFSLTIQPGESVAIVGHTGAGKSSLARLLIRLYEFEAGRINIDGNDIRDLDLAVYRKQIGLIPQTPFLFADTLEANVKYGMPNMAQDQVLWALNQAGGADWVQDLDQGLVTNVRERGKILSMGQRQLVAFARILLQNPSILILDEATASIDPFTEIRIQEALEKLIKGRTSIIIAHRLWTVQHVDRIIVFDHGQIVEEGSHDALLLNKGYYASLYNTYFRHQSLEFIENREI